MYLKGIIQQTENIDIPSNWKENGTFWGGIITYKLECCLQYSVYFKCRNFCEAESFAISRSLTFFAKIFVFENSEQSKSRLCSRKKIFLNIFDELNFNDEM